MQKGLRRSYIRTQQSPTEHEGGLVQRTMLFMILLTAGIARAQQPSPPSAPARIDSPSELDKLKESCFNLKGLPGCAQELFLGKPIHIAVGSIAPQNGFAAGLAYVGHKTTPNWRNSWNADAVASVNGSWRAGVYLKLGDPYEPAPIVTFGTKGRNMKSNLTSLPERPVINLYAQA